MVAAILASVAVMLLASKGIYAFVNRHPTVKMLALSFLLLIGFTLVAEGTGVHIPKGYIYFVMGFAVFVEWLDLRAGLRGRPVKLHDPYEEA
jgi:predicted tellurium resistance membrane protein TerC